MNYDNMRNYTEVTIKDAYGDYTVRVPQIDMNINVLIDTVIAPALKASGYLPEMVDTALGLDDEPGPYKAELEKILDALHCDCTQQAVQAIDELKKECSLNNHALTALLKEMEGLEFNFNVLRHRASELGLKL